MPLNRIYVENELWGDIITGIDDGTAVKVPAASFRQGAEDQIWVDFYRWYDMVIQHRYDGHSTRTELYQVVGEDLEIFNFYYK